MAQMPPIEINFTIDARRLDASRDVIAEVIHKARESDKSDAYWAQQMGIALLQKDFELGAQGLGDDPPFFLQKYAPGTLAENTHDVYAVCADGFIEGNEPQVIISVTQADVHGNPAQFADGMAATLNKIVYQWLEARIPEEPDDD